MAYSVGEAVELGNLVLAAYDLYAQRDPSGFKPPVPYTLVSKIYADDITDGIPDFRIFGFVAKSNSDIVVAIRGTENIIEWVWNFEFALDSFPYAAAGKTERGFTHFYSTLRTGPDSTHPRVFEALQALIAAGGIGTLRIAGHSLGSAVATMLALELTGKKVWTAPTVYTFASPRVGDATFANRYNSLVTESWRIVNRHDRVPDLPPDALGYAHVDTQKTIDSLNRTKPTIACFHQLRTYLNTLDNSVPLDTECVPGGKP